MLCTSVTATDVAGCLVQIDEAAAAGVDVVELRLDFLSEHFEVAELVSRCASRGVRSIATYRPTWEGGQYDGEEAPRLAALWAAVEAGAAYVDCELLAAERFFAADPGGVRAASGTKIILSSHNYDDVPSSDDLAKIHADCVAAGADIVKIAAMVKDITHVARLEKLLADARASDAEATIVLGMGEAGQVSRLLAAKFGSFLTFGALRSGAESASGHP